jgi:hypothetical protein
MPTCKRKRNQGSEGPDEPDGSDEPESAKEETHVKKGFMDMMTIINVFKQGAMNLSVPKFIVGQSRTKIQKTVRD